MVEKMTSYPWYEVIADVHESLQQGDFIDSCPLLIPPKKMEVKSTAIEFIAYDVIIMSQSCDLVNKKIDLVLVCPVWLLSEFQKKSDFLKSADGKEALRQGNMPGYHLLNKCDLAGFEKDFLVVDFRNVYSIPFTSLTNIATCKEKRLRLLPPYREHLSQAFARFFMRVGLPVDIASFQQRS